MDIKINARSRKRLAGILIAGAAMLLVAFFGANQPTVELSGNVTDGYKVIKVIDGDTIEVNYSGKVERVRLLGIDTPELHDPRKPVQCFGAEASKKSHELMDGMTVKLEADVTQGERDKYDRLLRYVYLPDGRMVNRVLVEEGYAHEYTYQSQPYKYQAEFKAAAQQAKQSSLGFWSDNTCGGDTKQPAAQ